MNLLIISDIHILEKDIPEINAIFDELLILADKHSINRLIIAGDTFDRVNPSPKEIDIFANFVRKLNKPVVIISANSHESISNTESILNHFGILKDTVSVVKDYEDDTHLYVGHFTLKESKMHYGAIKSKQELSQYKYVVLGHQHSFEIIPPNVCHLGSIRYIHFDEAKDDKKICLLIENYKEKTEKCHFIAINSKYPMVDLYVGQNPSPEVSCAKSIGEIKAYLDKLPKLTKVRLIFADFERYKEFLPLYDKYRQKFVEFKSKKEFDILSKANNVEASDILTLKDSLKHYLKQNKIPKSIQKILLEELK